jgi:hypothetical protein
VAVGDEDDGYAWAKHARAAGLPVMVQQNSMDLVAEFTLAEYNLFDYMPNWIQSLMPMTFLVTSGASSSNLPAYATSWSTAV